MSQLDRLQPITPQSFRKVVTNVQYAAKTRNGSFESHWIRTSVIESLARGSVFGGDETERTDL